MEEGKKRERETLESKGEQVQPDLEQRPENLGMCMATLHGLHKDALLTVATMSEKLTMSQKRMDTEPS